MLESILQQHSRDGKPDGAARTTQEIAITDDNSSLCLGAVCLQRDERRLKHKTNAGALNAQDDDHGADRRVPREDASQSRAKRPEEEPGPDDFAVALATGYVLARGYGKCHLRKRDREDQGGRDDGGELPDILEEEGEVVELRVVDYAEEEVLQQQNADGRIFEHRYCEPRQI